jgi:hypothetical protein
MQNELFDKVEKDAVSAANEHREALNRHNRLKLTSVENIILRICMFKEILVLTCLMYGLFYYIRPERCEMVKHDLH